MRSDAVVGAKRRVRAACGVDDANFGKTSCRATQPRNPDAASDRPRPAWFVNLAAALAFVRRRWPAGHDSGRRVAG